MKHAILISKNNIATNADKLRTQQAKQKPQMIYKQSFEVFA